MKILQVIPAIADRYGGPSEAVLSITRELNRRGHECLIATTDADGGGRLPVRCHRAGEWRCAPVVFFPRDLGESFKYSRSLARWLHGHVGEFDIVHVHAVFSHASLAAARACRAGGVPYVLRPMGTLDPVTMGSKQLRKRIYWHLCGRNMAMRAAAVHYATARERAAVESSLGLDNGFVVPIGVELDGAPPRVSRPRTARADGETPPYVLVIARLDPIKRIDLLMEAFVDASSTPELCHWRLRVAGDGPARHVRRLHARARATGASERIDFLGWVGGRQKDALLAQAALFALTSRHENFGRSVAEALLAGVPAVVTRDVYLCDLVAGAGAGWVAAGTREAVAGALREAMSDADERRRRGENAARLARGRLGISGTVGELVERYQAIVRHARARSSSGDARDENSSLSLAGLDVEPPA